MKDSPEAIRERQRRWRDKMKEDGFAQVQCWVPENQKDNIRQIAEILRDYPDINTHELSQRLAVTINTPK